MSRRESTSAPSARIPGVVDEFTRSKIRGSVSVPLAAPAVRVSLWLNDIEVAVTWAAAGGEPIEAGLEVRDFSFRLQDLWTYVRVEDQLTVRAGGRALLIAGYGKSRSPIKSGKRTPDKLRALLSNGNVFSYRGELQRSKQLDGEWQQQTMGIYDAVRAIVAQEYSRDVFLMYGTLLGAVRDGGFMAHDANFDAGFVSSARDGPSAAAELKAIALTLVARGFTVDCRASCLHIRERANPAVRIGLFHLYFGADGLLQFPFGTAGTTQIAIGDWAGTKEIEFANRTVLVPGIAEQMVEAIYGSRWVVPQLGFDWDHERTNRDWSGVVPTAWRDEVERANPGESDPRAAAGVPRALEN